MEKSQKRKYILVAVLLILLTNAVTVFLISSGVITIGNRVVVTANNEETARGLQKLAFLKEKIDETYYQDIDDQVLLEGAMKGGNRVVVTANNEETARGLQKLAFLKEKIDETYYQDIDDQVLLEGAMKGMFEATGDQYSGYFDQEAFQNLMETSTGSFSGIGVVVTEDENQTTMVVTPYKNTDQYSGYFDQEAFQNLMETSTGSFSGIGVVVTEDENQTTMVVTPYKNTPAGNAGVQSGDKIIAVNDEDVTGKGMDYTVDLMRGEAGTPVKISVQRGEETHSFDLVREQIDTPTVDSKNIDGIGYISISEFTQKTSEDFNTQLDALLAQNISGLIIDLRYNGGGLITSSVAVADRLLGDTEIVYTVNKNGDRKDYRSTADVQLDIPLVVLVNEGTASASEILSGAIQDTGKGTLLGTKTFGKGIVQDVVPLSDGSGYRLTSATYFTPNGRSIHGEGLTPDVVVDQNEAYQKVLNVPEDQDVQLQNALGLFRN